MKTCSIAICFVVLSATSVHAAVINVPTTAHPTIQAGIDNALAGGFRCEEEAYAKLYNSVISGNKSSASEIGGIHINLESSLKIVNSIIWGNQQYAIGVNYGGVMPGVSLLVTNSIIEGVIKGIRHYNGGASVYWLNANLNADPMFRDRSNGDFSLQAGSPGIDTGIQDTLIVFNNDKDTLFIPVMEFIGVAIDIGAYEFDTEVNIIEQQSMPVRSFHIQNYPNPFTHSTTIEFAIPASAFVTLKIYNNRGQEVSTLISEKQQAGQYRYSWNAGTLPDGLYIYIVRAGNFTETRKMTMVH